MPTAALPPVPRYAAMFRTLHKYAYNIMLQKWFSTFCIELFELCLYVLLLHVSNFITSLWHNNQVQNCDQLIASQFSYFRYCLPTWAIPRGRLSEHAASSRMYATSASSCYARPVFRLLSCAVAATSTPPKSCSTLAPFPACSPGPSLDSLAPPPAPPLFTNSVMETTPESENSLFYRWCSPFYCLVAE